MVLFLSILSRTAIEFRYAGGMWMFMVAFGGELYAWVDRAETTPRLEVVVTNRRLNVPFQILVDRDGGTSRLLCDPGTPFRCRFTGDLHQEDLRFSLPEDESVSMGLAKAYFGRRFETDPRVRRPKKRVLRLPVETLAFSIPVDDLPGTGQLSVRGEWVDIEPFSSGYGPESDRFDSLVCDGHVLVSIEPIREDVWSFWPATLTFEGAAPNRRTQFNAGRMDTVVQPHMLKGATLSAFGSRCDWDGVRTGVVDCGDASLAIHVEPACKRAPNVGPGEPMVLPLGEALVIHPNLSCTSASNSFLEPRFALESDRTPQTCGGRPPGATAYDIVATSTQTVLPRGVPFYGGRGTWTRTRGPTPRALPHFPWLPKAD